MKAPQLITPERSGSASGAPLGEAAVSGVIWQTASFVLGKLLILVSTIILARLLLPRDFGLVGLALVFITYADVVTDLGVAQALVFFRRLPLGGPGPDLDCAGAPGARSMGHHLWLPRGKPDLDRGRVGSGRFPVESRLLAH